MSWEAYTYTFYSHHNDWLFSIAEVYFESLADWRKAYRCDLKHYLDKGYPTITEIEIRYSQIKCSHIIRHAVTHWKSITEIHILQKQLWNSNTSTLFSYSNVYDRTFWNLNQQEDVNLVEMSDIDFDLAQPDPEDITEDTPKRKSRAGFWTINNHLFQSRDESSDYEPSIYSDSTEESIEDVDMDAYKDIVEDTKYIIERLDVLKSTFPYEDIHVLEKHLKDDWSLIQDFINRLDSEVETEFFN